MTENLKTLNDSSKVPSFKSLKEKHFNLENLDKNLNLSLQKVINFYKDIDKIPVRTDVKPGFIYDKYKQNFPHNPMDLESLLNEYERDIFPNMCLWQHPKFFAYYAAPVCDTAITLEMLNTAFGNPNFNWNVSPAAHEIEWVVMDWLVEMLGLGQKFTFDKGGCGGCTYATTEGNFLSVNVAKYKKINELDLSEFDSRRLKFVGYYPYTNKSWAEKVLTMNSITQKRCLNVYYSEETGNYNINPIELRETIKKDIENGLVPLWYGGQIGATYCGSTCQLNEIGPILKEFGVYFNVDAAHAGLFLMLPECRVEGLEYVNNININFVKTGMSSNQGSVLFNDDKESLILSTGAIDGEIYRTGKSGIKIDYKDFTVGFGRRLNGLKLYGLLKTIGVSGYQEYLRNCIDRGNYFLSLMEKNPRFELFCKPIYGLVCFRLKPIENQTLEAYNEIIDKLQELMNINTEEGYVSSASINGIKFMRFVSNNPLTEEIHVDELCKKIEKTAETLK